MRRSRADDAEFVTALFARPHVARFAHGPQSDDEFRVHRVFLEVLASNTGARALYERVGFTSEGCYRDGCRADDGTYHDLVPYGLLASERR